MDHFNITRTVNNVLSFHSIAQRSEAWSNDKKEMIQSFFQVLGALELLRFSTHSLSWKREAERELYFFATETSIAKKQIVTVQHQIKKKNQNK